MMSRDAEKLSVLRMLKSAVKYAAIEKGGADSVPDRPGSARRRAQGEQEARGFIAQYTQAGRTDLADKEKKELDS